VLNGVLPPTEEELLVAPGALLPIEDEPLPAAPLVCARTGADSASAPAIRKHERICIVVASLAE
jgi:hypothetical protein